MQTKTLSPAEVVDAFMESSIVDLAKEFSRRGISVNVTMGPEKEDSAASNPAIDENVLKVLSNDDPHVVLLVNEARRLAELSVKFEKDGQIEARNITKANSWAYALSGAWLRVQLERKTREQPSS